ncbi:MAG: hypothetical protein J6B61_03180 [Romboutsia sp.]|nr:hypothetical protein [Romboutsia sp.]MBP3929485.1 hypothetical protein [Peptostreptococcaceae bacterium]
MNFESGSKDNLLAAAKKMKQKTKEDLAKRENTDTTDEVVENTDVTTEDTSVSGEQKNNNKKVIKKVERRERVPFSFKLDAEEADKLITYYMSNEGKLTDIIEESILRMLKKEKVKVDNDLVQAYHQQKKDKKEKAKQNKEIKEKMKLYEEQLKREMAGKKSN